MRNFLASPWRASAVSAAAAAMVIAFAAMAAKSGIVDVAAISLRSLHVIAAFVWAGFIVFVNLVQLVVLAEVADSEKPVLVRNVLPRVGLIFTIAAHLTLATGLLQLVPLYSALAARPILVLAVLGGLTMWTIVHFVLRPNVCRVTGRIPANDAEKAKARTAVALWARVNLVLVLPVTVGMLVAAHWGV